MTKGCDALDVEADFRAFVLARRRALLRTAWLLTGDWAAAEDLVQASLLRAWPHWSRVTAAAGSEAYVRRILYNRAIDWRRHRWRRELPVPAVPDMASLDASSQVALHELVVSAVLTLPPRQRAVVVLRYFEDLTEAESAVVLGCTVGTVKSQTAKAFATLRRLPHLHELLLEESPA